MAELIGYDPELHQRLENNQPVKWQKDFSDLQASLLESQSLL